MRKPNILLMSMLSFVLIRESRAQSLIWTEIGAGNIDSVSFAGAANNTVASGLSTPYGITFDPATGQIFWTDVIGGKIWRSNRDGSDATAIISGLNLPRGITFDEACGKIYWVENGSKKIRSANIDGSGVADVVTTGLSAPTGIAFDPTDSTLYWTDNGGTMKYIGSCNDNGSDVRKIDSTTSFVSGIFVDAVHSEIYWTEYGPEKKICRANPDGSDVVTVDSFATSDPRDIFVSPAQGKIFWTDYVTDQIESASLDGAGESVLATGFNNPLSIYGTEGIDKSLAVQVSSPSAAAASPNSVVIRWRTQSEVDNAGFVILRRDSGASSFKVIASYKNDAGLKGMGTSSTGRSYAYTDDAVNPGESYVYMIESVSTKGATTDLSTLSIKVDVPAAFALYQNYPNPFNPSTTIRFDLKEQSNVTLAIYNVLGQEVEHWNYGMMEAGRYNKDVNMARFASGVYFYRIIARGLKGDRFVSIKKMLELK